MIVVVREVRVCAAHLLAFILCVPRFVPPPPRINLDSLNGTKRSMVVSNNPLLSDLDSLTGTFRVRGWVVWRVARGLGYLCRDAWGGGGDAVIFTCVAIVSSTRLLSRVHRCLTPSHPLPTQTSHASVLRMGLSLV